MVYNRSSQALFPDHQKPSSAVEYEYWILVNNHFFNVITQHDYVTFLKT